MNSDNDETKDFNSAEEPSQAYETTNSNRFQTFNSPHEINESQYEHWRKLSPIQRLQEHYKLLLINYTTEELNGKGNRIIFDR